MDLSLVIPAFNEEQRILPSLEAIRRYLDGTGEEYEVIVVDDCSTDGLADKVRDVAIDWTQLSMRRLPVNSGKGAAIREGMLAATGDHCAFSDADLSTPIEELSQLREHLKGECAVAIGSRALPGSYIKRHQPWRREAMGRMYNRLLRLLVMRGIMDTQCGFKVFTREAAATCFATLECPRFGFDAEVLIRARNHGWTVAEVPVTWSDDPNTTVRALKDSTRMLIELIHLRQLRNVGRA